MATSQQLTVTATMTSGDTQDVTSGATYTSSDEAVATITGGGLVEAVAPGTATVTATYEGQTGTCTVTVTEPEPGVETLAVEPAAVDLESGA